MRFSLEIPRLIKVKLAKLFNVSEISNMLGISRAEGYKFVKSPECPFLVLRIERRLIIPTNNFFNWYESLARDPIAERIYFRMKQAIQMSCLKCYDRNKMEE